MSSKPTAKAGKNNFKITYQSELKSKILPKLTLPFQKITDLAKHKIVISNVGYIKALGENVKCKFKIDNPVLAFCGTQNQTIYENENQDTLEDAIRSLVIK